MSAAKGLQGEEVRSIWDLCWIEAVSWSVLDLAVFTDADTIDPAIRQQLKPLWGRVL